MECSEGNYNALQFDLSLCPMICVMVLRHRYMYTQIDCKDMTFDSKNDDARWHRIGLYKGGRAKAISEVAQEFCGKLTDYPIFTLYGLPTGPA